jgi:hypothetical protein
VFAYLKYDGTGRVPRAISYSLLVLTLLWGFLSTLDGPVVNFTSNPGSIGYSQTPRNLLWEYAGQAETPTTGLFHDQPRVLQAFSLFFNFTHDLRRWPVLTSAISRSPPLSDL